MPIRTDVEVGRATPGARRPKIRPLTLNNTVGLPATQVQLDDVQAIVATDFRGCQEAEFLLLRIVDERACAQWLEWIATQVCYVAGEHNDIRPTAVNVAFAHSGLDKLGLERRALDEFPDTFRTDGLSAESRAHRLGDEGDSSPERWTWGNEDDPVDVLVLLYAVDAAALANHLTEHRRRAVENGLQVVTTLPAASFGPPFKEPFGFVDGISQPAIDQIDLAVDGERAIATGEFLLGYPNERGSYTPSPTVAADGASDEKAKLEPASSGSRRSLGRNGTYLVFRQLEQDVLAFWQTAEAQAKSKPSAGPLAKWGAKMIGRWPNGAPLVRYPNGDPGRNTENDFLYRKLDDDLGFSCPAGAHVRRTNPRDSLARTDGYRSLAVVRQHRIVRRSRPYGDQIRGWPHPDEIVLERDRSQHRGIYFICLNADLSQQFEFIQERWMNDPTFVSAKSGERDPLVGNPGPNATFTVPAAPVPVCFGGNGTPLHRFVTVRGSGYFFLPSRRALHYLSAVAGRGNAPRA
jgi:Dyp-type peroxidase family